ISDAGGEKYPAVNYGYPDIFAGEVVDAVQDVGADVDRDRIVQLPYGRVGRGQGIEAAIPGHRDIIAGRPAIPQRLLGAAYRFVDHYRPDAGPGRQGRELVGRQSNGHGVDQPQVTVYLST